MKLLDLFCGAGGAAMGYHQAGFTEIVGVDIDPQPNYPFMFIQGDATRPPINFDAFDLIHASPPCQVHTALVRMRNGEEAGDEAQLFFDGLPAPDRGHKDHVAATRALLKASGRPYVIENVPGAPLLNPVVLCGSMFGLSVRRHRLFELGLWTMDPPPCDHKSQGQVVGVYGDLSPNRRRVKAVGNGGGWKASYREAPQAMGITHPMTTAEVVLAIPPAYTRLLAERFLG